MTTLALSPSCFTPSLTKRKSRAFGLLEVILVFAIVIGAAAIVFTVFQSAQHRADVEHDRTLVRTLGANIGTLFHSPWDSSSGPGVMMAYITAPTVVGGPSCTGPDLDGSPSEGQGCYSALTGMSIHVGELDQGTTGTAYDVQIQGVQSPADCADFLTGGPGAFGAVGVSSDQDPLGVWAKPTSQGDVLTWCQGHLSGDGIIQLWWGHS